jgi:hypothetical protein
MGFATGLGGMWVFGGIGKTGQTSSFYTILRVIKIIFHNPTIGI